MRNMKLLIAGISAAILVTGCGVTQDGFSSNSLQKRKYTKGFYISKRSHLKAKHENATNETLVDTDVTTNDEAVVLEKRAVKQVATAEKKVERQHDYSNKDVAVAKENPVKKDVPVSKEDLVSTESEKNHSRISDAEKKDVKSLLKQKKRESGSSMADDLLIICVILCFFIPPLAVGIWTNIDWTKVLISLLLTLLFFLPGVIYSLLVVLDKI